MCSLYAGMCCEVKKDNRKGYFLAWNKIIVKTRKSQYIYARNVLRSNKLNGNILVLIAQFLKSRKNDMRYRNCPFL